MWYYSFLLFHVMTVYICALTIDYWLISLDHNEAAVS